MIIFNICSHTIRKNIFKRLITFQIKKLQEIEYELMTSDGPIGYCHSINIYSHVTPCDVDEISSMTFWSHGDGDGDVI